MKRLRNICLCTAMAAIMGHGIAAADDGFSDMDKFAFGLVVAAQIFDGLTTVAFLDNHHNRLDPRFSWKYGSDRRPSSSRIWTVKTAEIGIAYIVAKAMPDEYRSAFLFAVAGVLIACGFNNGMNFAITY